MKVDFFNYNEQLDHTMANYLFSQECSLIVNGQYIEHDDQWYQVAGQTIPDDKGSPLVVFLSPYRSGQS